MTNENKVVLFTAWKGPTPPDNPVSGEMWIESEECEGEVSVVARRKTDIEIEPVE